MKWLGKGLLGGWALLLAASWGLSQPPGGVTLQTVKYDGLREAVLKNRGNVVVVDFWAFF